MNIAIEISDDVTLYEMIKEPMLYSFYDNKNLEDEIFEENIEQLMIISGDFVKSKNFITECIIKASNEYLSYCCCSGYLGKIKNMLDFFGILNRETKLYITDGYYYYDYENDTIYADDYPVTKIKYNSNLMDNDLTKKIDLKKFNKIILKNLNKRKILNLITENDIKLVRKLNKDYVKKYIKEIYINNIPPFSYEVEITYADLRYTDIKYKLLKYLNKNNFKKYLKTGRV